VGKTVKCGLIAAALAMPFPVQATTPVLPPPYMDVEMLQFLCGTTYGSTQDQERYAATCRGYVRAIVDRYFETDYRAKKRQLFPRCDWQQTTDALIAEVKASRDGPVEYSHLSRAEPWLREILAKKCNEKP